MNRCFLKHLAILLCFATLLAGSGLCSGAKAEAAAPALYAGTKQQAKVGFSFSLPVYRDTSTGEALNTVRIGFDVIPADANDTIHVRIDKVDTASSAQSEIIGDTVTVTDRSGFANGYVCDLSLTVDAFESAGDTFVLELYTLVQDTKCTFGTCTITVSPLAIGDTIMFGRYEQDAYAANGPEPVEWRVLDIQDDRILVISQYVLDHVAYYPTQYATTWEKSYLRDWLNKEFIDTAFSENEVRRIVEVTVEPHRNPFHDSPDSRRGMGNATKDRVFLLDAAEAELYFSSDKERQAYSTSYAKQQNVSYDEETLFSNWMLRQPGRSGGTTANVDFYGRASSGANVSHPRTGLRPAMWILRMPPSAE